MTSDICIFDFHKDAPTMSQVLGTIKAYKHAFPEFEILQDGDRYGIYARRKVCA